MCFFPFETLLLHIFLKKLSFFYENFFQDLNFVELFETRFSSMFLNVLCSLFEYEKCTDLNFDVIFLKILV